MSSSDVAKAFGYLTQNEVEILHELVSVFKYDPVVINIGAGAGTSGLALYESKYIWLYTIDIQEESSPFGCLEGERNAFRNAGYGDSQANHFQICGDSKDIGKKWSGLVDIVFVDGDHSYTGCRGDIDAWLPHIKEGGIIAFHDYGSRWADVKRAVDEVFSNPYKKADTIVSFIVSKQNAKI